VIKKFLRTGAMCLLVVAIHEAAGKDKGAAGFRYDRLDVLQQFIKAVYPDLADRLAMFNIRATLEGSRGVTVRNLNFYPCSATSGLTPTDDVPVIQPTLQQDSASSEKLSTQLPKCGEQPTAEFEHFLDVSLGLTPGQQNHPIFRFAASGSYIDRKLQDLRQQFVGKRYPTDDIVLHALNSSSPKYGPDDKRAFLQMVPLDRIQRLTGCHLHPDSARFVVELEENPQHLPPDLQWHLSGNAPAVDGLSATTCWATFEPFDGHLTMFMD
jgi:hypothetical protein